MKITKAGQKILLDPDEGYGTVVAVGPETYTVNWHTGSGSPYSMSYHNDVEWDNVITAPCANGAHMACPSPDECVCPSCHFICGNCGKKCRVLHEFEASDTRDPLDGSLLCASCWKAASAADPKSKWPVCSGCGEHKRVVYREPRSDDNRHLCTACHKASGHRYKDNHGNWVTDIPAL